MKAGPYSIGSDTWNGLTKLMEEAAEVIQVAAKIQGAGGERIHFDGSDLQARMVDEIGDLEAAIRFFVNKNGLDPVALAERASKKYALFEKWDAQERLCRLCNCDLTVDGADCHYSMATIRGEARPQGCPKGPKTP